MKKAVLLFTVVSLFCVSVFAEKLTVSVCEGKVTFLSGDNWLNVKEGIVLDTENLISTGLNASVVFDNGLSIKPMKKGKIADLIEAEQFGFILGSNLTKESIKELVAVDRTDKLGRASEAKEDLDWDE